MLHYSGYIEGEVKALWEFLEISGRKLEVIGILGPISPENPTEAVDLGLEVHYEVEEKDWKQQSVAFIVL